MYLESQRLEGNTPDVNVNRAILGGGFMGTFNFLVNIFQIF